MILKKLYKQWLDLFNQRMFLHYLKGDNVYCPICDSSFLTFLPFGRIKRVNALCPKCNSLERHRMQFLYIKEKTSILYTSTTLLHIAPEVHLYNIFKANPNISYHCIDKFTEGYSYPDDVIDMDITDLKYPEETFDVVICNHVLEHIQDDKKAMSSIYKVLKKNGVAFLQVPIEKTRQTTFEDFSITDPLEREKLFGQFDHVRVYGRDYSDRLREAGFSVDIVDMIEYYGAHAEVLYGLMKNDDLYICTKNG